MAEKTETEIEQISGKGNGTMEASYWFTMVVWSLTVLFMLVMTIRRSNKQSHLLKYNTSIGAGMLLYIVGGVWLTYLGNTDQVVPANEALVESLCALTFVGCLVSWMGIGRPIKGEEEDA